MNKNMMMTIKKARGSTKDKSGILRKVMLHNPKILSPSKSFCHRAMVSPIARSVTNTYIKFQILESKYKANYWT